MWSVGFWMPSAHSTFSSVQFSHLVVSDPLDCRMPGSLSIMNSRSLLTLMPIELVMPSNHLILCHLLVLPLSFFPTIRVFSNESALCIRWPKYRSFSISLSTEYSGLIFFKMDWISLQSQGLSRVSPTPQFKSISFLVLIFLYSPALTSIRDYWKNHYFY